MHAAACSGEGSKLVWIQRAIAVLIREIKEMPACRIELKLWLFVRRCGGDAHAGGAWGWGPGCLRVDLRFR